MQMLPREERALLFQLPPCSDYMIISMNSFMTEKDKILTPFPNAAILAGYKSKKEG
jgi:hypothetical protein